MYPLYMLCKNRGNLIQKRIKSVYKYIYIGQCFCLTFGGPFFNVYRYLLILKFLAGGGSHRGRGVNGEITRKVVFFIYIAK